MTIRTRPPRKRSRKPLWHVDDLTPRELLIFCPGCKALDVIRFSGQEWIPTRKFTQRSGSFFHDCGSAVPCRLHGGVQPPSSPGKRTRHAATRLVRRNGGT